MPEVLTSETTVDTHGMVVIHRAFRRESRQLAELVAAVADGDTDRAAILGRHLAWYQSGLANHHHGEDELLWPLLRRRAHVGAEIVERMERQHGHVADTLAEVVRALPTWHESAAAKSRDQLVTALCAHRDVLIEHLDDEEDHLLPLAAQHLTVPELEALGGHFVATTPKADLLIFLGAVLEEATADEQDALLGAMPLAARLAWRSVGRRRYALRIRRVRAIPADQSRPPFAKNLREA